MKKHTSKNYGLAGGELDATKHVNLAMDPVAYMKRLADRPWLLNIATQPEHRAATCVLPNQN